MPDTDEFERLIKENMGLVHACARRFIGRGAEYDDLTGAGSVGLVKAARGFDPSRGFAFSTYAVPLILGEIRRVFRDGGAVKLGRTSKEKALALLKTADALRERLQREPTVGELAAAAGTEPAETAALLSAMLPPVSLTDPEGTGENDIPVESGEERVLEKIMLFTALGQLSGEDRALVRLRYFENLTQTEAGRRLGLTQVQVSRREKRVLERLRALM
ncbi:MAG: sigma-70 family RNA polymerase sigma factor [Clostridia bacterium]|nr:sigma-70 family RNA polymerase sigma factor [Clostridia bacterium]